MEADTAAEKLRCRMLFRGLVVVGYGLSAAMKLADFTSSSLMIPHLVGREAAAVIQELGEVLCCERRIPDLVCFVNAVRNRELLAHTEMETSIAFPHARLPELPELCFALGRSHEPLAWKPHAAPSVSLVFLIAVPANDSSQYLPLISGLARLSMERRLIKLLHEATDASAIFEVLQGVELTPRASLLAT